MEPRDLLRLLKKAFDEWSSDNASMLAAGLAYYTIFSLAPLLMMLIAVAGMFLGRGEVEAEILVRVGEFGGPEAVRIVDGVLANVTDPASMLTASVLSTVFLFVGALGLFLQMRRALNIIWDVQPEGGKEKVLYFLRSYGVSFLMLLVVGFLLVLLAVLTVAISSVSRYLIEILPVDIGFVKMLNFMLYFTMVSLLLSFAYKVLAGVRLGWGDVFIGSIVTSLLFTAGTIFIELYIRYGNVGSVYGAASSLVVVLLWVYYVSQIFLYGAEFIKVYSTTMGSRKGTVDNS